MSPANELLAAGVEAAGDMSLTSLAQSRVPEETRLHTLFLALFSGQLKATKVPILFCFPVSHSQGRQAVSQELKADS